MRPLGPFDIPAEAFAALQELRDALEPVLPPEGRFGIGVKRDGDYVDDLALVVTLAWSGP